MSVGILGLLLLPQFQLTAQEKPTVINLTVIHNSHQRPAPAEIKVTFDGLSMKIPLRHGTFEVPQQLIAAQNVTFETGVEGSHIRITKLAGADFAEGNWTLRLAERSNDDYAWPGPKGVNISTTCMLEFDSGHEDPARGRFVQNCRSKAR